MRLRLVVLAALLLTPSSALAADRTVTSTADSGPGTLRQWLVDANAGDRILVPAGTITLASQLVVTKDLTIRGAGRALTTIDADDNSRVIAATAGTLTLEELTLQDGRLTNPTSDEGGAGVAQLSADSSDTLTLTNVAVRDCVVTGGADTAGGGAIFSDGQNVVIGGSALTGNGVVLTAPDLFVAGGGAIFNNGGDVTVSDSEITGNTLQVSSASPDNTGGGAIYTNGGDLLSLTSTIVRDNHLTVTSDAGATSGNGNGGGAIHSISSLTTLVDSAVDENTATISVHEPFSDGGGGIYTNGGDLSLADSSVSANTATVSKLATGTESDTSGGGGVYLNGGDLALAGSTVADNAAVLSNGDSDNDGGAGVHSNGGGFDIDGSTISGNELTMTVTAGATQSGGGGYFGYTRPGSAMVNSTFSGNSAQINGGGTQMGGGAVFLWAVLEPAQLTNLTIAGNSTNRSGGGLFNMLPPLKNTIVAGNTGGDCAWGEPEEDVSLGHNLSGDGTCGFDAAGDKSGVDPKLKPLGDYGGITLTHDLNDGSPALDAGKDCPSADQRGLARPFGPACDIGAVESGSSTVAPVDQNTGGGGGGGGGGDGLLGTPNPAPPQAPVVCGGFGTILPPCLGQVPQPEPVVTCGPSFGTILRSCEGLGLRFGGRPINLDEAFPVEAGCGPSPRSARAAFLKKIAKFCRVSMSVAPSGLPPAVTKELLPKLSMGPELGKLLGDTFKGLDQMKLVGDELAGKSLLVNEGLKVPNAEFEAAFEGLAGLTDLLDGLEASISQLAVAPPGRRTALVSSTQRRGGGVFGRIAREVQGIAGSTSSVLPGLGEGVGGPLSESLRRMTDLNGGLTQLFRDLPATVREDSGAPAADDDRRSARAAQARRRRVVRSLLPRLVIASADAKIPYGTKRTLRLKLAPWVRPLLRRARGRSMTLRFSAVIAQNGSAKRVSRRVKVRVRGRRR